MTDRHIEIRSRVDTAGWARQLGGFATKVLPYAASYAINGTLFAARDALRDEAKRVFDRPVAFTFKSAFGYTMARLDGVDMRARVFIKDRQSAYYHYQINGGARVPGNIGPGEKWLFMPVAPELIDGKAGGLKKNVLKGLARRASAKAAQGQALHRTTAARDAKRKRVFFAPVFGTQGIWERPERSKATMPRRRGVRQVHNLAAPRLLVAASQTQQYERPRFDYAGIVAKAQVDLPLRFSEAVEMKMRPVMSESGLR